MNKTAKCGKKRMMEYSKSAEETISSAAVDYDETPALPSKLKTLNRENILKCFRDGKEHTASDISGMTGISKITTMRAVRFFCEKGVLETRGKAHQTKAGGKYPELFRINVRQYILSIAIWSGVISFTLMDFGGTVIDQSVYSDINTLKMTMDEILNFVTKRLALFQEKVGIAKDEVYGVFVSTSGIIDYQKKRIIYNAQAPGWGKNVYLLEPIKKLFGKHTHFFLDNGGKVIARALLLDPVIRQKRVMLITTSWGISGCFISNGKILNGKTSLIGEVGHMIIDINDKEQCNCGSYGCLERLVDIRRIREDIETRQLPPDSKLNEIPKDQIDEKLLFRLASQGDETSQRYVHYLADCFAYALRNISLVFDPQIVVFVGDYAYAGEFFDKCIRSKLNEFRYYSDENTFDIVYEQRTMLEMDYTGAAVAIEDHYFSNPELYEGE